MVRNVGIDDWAIFKRCTYASIIVDLDSHKIIDLIPSCNEDDVACWLDKFPYIEPVSRDGTVFFEVRLSVQSQMQLKFQINSTI